MKSVKSQKQERLTEGMADWILSGAVLGPIAVAVVLVFYLQTKDQPGTAKQLIGPPPASSSPAQEAPSGARRVDARLLGILIHPTNREQSSARIALPGTTGTFLVGDSVGGGTLEAVNSDHVVLRVGQETQILSLAVESQPKTGPTVDHARNREHAAKMPGFVQTSEPAPDKPLPPTVGNDAFRAALEKAREGAAKK